MDEERQLIEKLRKIEQLFARPGTAGERDAAQRASDRLRARLAALEPEEPAIEYRFSLPDAWSRRLFTALLRRHGLHPYRYTGQRRTTIMVRVAKSFLDQTLWPEFEQAQALLHAHFEAVTRRVIAQAIGGTGDDVDVRDGDAPNLEA